MCIYIYMCTYVYIYIHVCVCVYIYTYMHVYIYIYVHIHMYICVYMCIYVYMYICIYVYMYICIYVYMYVYIYIYMCISQLWTCFGLAFNRWKLYLGRTGNLSGDSWPLWGVFCVRPPKLDLSWAMHRSKWPQMWFSIVRWVYSAMNSLAGWWFGTFLVFSCIFPYIGNNHPNWLSYFS